MADPRNIVSHLGNNAHYETYEIDNSTITYDATKANGSSQVGLAVTIDSSEKLALVGDGEGVEGKLITVEADGKATVQTKGYLTLPGGSGATLTNMKKIVGDLGPSSAKGYIREVNTATAAELGLARGRAGRALPHLEEAARGEPESAEWQYRLGCALLALRRPGDARAALERCVAIDEEYAYGAVLLGLAESYLATGESERALDALERFERNHGESPESAYRMGLTYKRLGRKEESQEAFQRVGRIASNSVGFQKREAGVWAMRAWVAKLF